MEYVPRETVFHKSLVEVPTIAGVERRLAIINGTIGAATFMGFHVLWFMPVSIVMHIFLIWVTKHDPLIVPIYMRYNRQGDRYDPWPRAQQKVNARPDGFGKGMLC